MSCSTVNGETICEKQTSSGNSAGAFSGAFSGQNGSYQDAAAMTGSTLTGQSQSSRTVVDRHTRRGFRAPSFYQNSNAGWMRGSGHLIGTGASDATSFRSDTGHTGISTSGFAGTSNNNGIPGPAFGGFAVADSSGNRFYGGGNTYGGGYAHGYGDSDDFDAVSQVLSKTGMGSGFPFNIFGRKR
ncbi:hypothetical protein AVEN_6855-1 [Araneus ventricosus]|uniref:Uncharacterized protein n=1 Tax=Araneus ventricosus TaxID=182803 RepID=A0A4Y2GT50_ARAVE|nr:hypothetical protein AVEN_6855-1 [Araneus ventricosus]